MVIEYIRYALPPERADELVAAYASTADLLQQDEHCLGFEVARGVEEPGNIIVRIEWDSVVGHEQGFRTSPAFSQFFAAVRPFFGAIEEMKHYQVRELSGSA